MDNTTNSQQIQDSSTQPLSHDVLSATLAHATNLHESMLPQGQAQTPQAPQEAHAAPQQEIAPETPKGPVEPKEPQKEEDSEAKLELKITDKLDAIRKELKDDQKGQIDSLRREIENALNAQEKE